MKCHPERRCAPLRIAVEEPALSLSKGPAVAITLVVAFLVVIPQRSASAFVFPTTSIVISTEATDNIIVRCVPISLNQHPTT
jgi:hypothetical protein